MSLAADEARWRREARSVLTYLTLRAVPRQSRADGLRAFLFQVAGDILEPEVAPLKIEGLGRRIWRRPITASNLSHRMSRAGIPSPMTWVTAYRAAATGVMMSYGVKISMIASTLSFSAISQVHAILKSAVAAVPIGSDAHLYFTHCTIGAGLREGKPDLGFRLFVRPLIPDGTNPVWMTKIEPLK